MKWYVILFLTLDTEKIQIVGAIRKVPFQVSSNVLFFIFFSLLTFLGYPGAVAPRDSIRQRSKQGRFNLFRCNLPWSDQYVPPYLHLGSDPGFLPFPLSSLRIEKIE